MAGAYHWANMLCAVPCRAVPCRAMLRFNREGSTLATAWLPTGAGAVDPAAGGAASSTNTVRLGMPSFSTLRGREDRILSSRM